MSKSSLFVRSLLLTIAATLLLGCPAVEIPFPIDGHGGGQKVHSIAFNRHGEDTTVFAINFDSDTTAKIQHMWLECSKVVRDRLTVMNSPIPGTHMALENGAMPVDLDVDVAPNGDLHVIYAYMEFISGLNDAVNVIRYIRTKDGQWQNPQTLLIARAGQVLTDICVDDNGHVHMAYGNARPVLVGETEKTFLDVVYVSPSGVLEYLEYMTQGSLASEATFSLTVDSSSNPAVAYYYSSSYPLPSGVKYTKFRYSSEGGTWTNEVLQDIVLGPIAFANGGFHTVWMTSGVKYFSFRNADGTWTVYDGEDDHKFRSGVYDVAYDVTRARPCALTAYSANEGGSYYVEEKWLGKISDSPWNRVTETAIMSSAETYKIDPRTGRRWMTLTLQGKGRVISYQPTTFNLLDSDISE